MSIASTCIQGKMEVQLEMFHCDRAHLFAVRSSSLASQYIMRLCCKANIWVDYQEFIEYLQIKIFDLECKVNHYEEVSEGNKDDEDDDTSNAAGLQNE